MKSDFSVITHKLPKEINGKPLESISIFCLGDWHIGSKQCDGQFIQDQIDMILESPDRFCVITGDCLNNGLKQSRTNSYEEVIQAGHDQAEVLYQYLKPLAEANRILAVVDGNHEHRSLELVGSSPLYGVCCRLGIEDLWRPYMCLLKICFGECGFGRKGSQNVYGGLVIHGSSRNKHRKYEMCFDNISFCCSGHTHQPEIASRSRIKLDLIRGVAGEVPFKSIVAAPALTHGGYAIQKEYEPSGTREVQWLTLHAIKADREKKMSVHSMQI